MSKFGKASKGKTTATATAAPAAPATVIDGTSSATVPADLLAQLEAERAENARLRQAITAQSTGNVSWKPQPSGAVSIYGVAGPRPVTLFEHGWEVVAAKVPEVIKFYADRKAEDGIGWRQKYETDDVWKARAIKNGWLDEADFVEAARKKAEYASRK